jgi:hypothetical protein
VRITRVAAAAARETVFEAFGKKIGRQEIGIAGVHGPRL